MLCGIIWPSLGIKQYHHTAVAELISLAQYGAVAYGALT